MALRSAADPAHPLIASHEAGLRLRVLKAASVLVDRLTYDAVTIDDVARDLHAYLVALTYCLKVGGAASTVANLLAEAIRSEEFAVQFRQTLLRERRQGFLAILLRGQRRGQIRDDVDLVMVIDAVYGAIHHRLIATGQDIDGAFLRHLTHFAIDGAANPDYLESHRARKIGAPAHT
ncbi:TetR-like C-terminal domain-containing protein [Arthrobacter sp. ISL-5]|uniref:TetR-like C-terminal domain-containing protein n=1 Tax=Arthrobacter sp. ISL-5 TaxID=2819111 RepID=UPI001BE9202F|nr:TetR/AcrR family transcriptional regulator C-terminal ligand-binding domain-containing protein [Arthrobacter sp. ISL-5]